MGLGSIGLGPGNIWIHGSGTKGKFVSQRCGLGSHQHKGITRDVRQLRLYHKVMSHENRKPKMKPGREEYQYLRTGQGRGASK